jgi:Cu-Zn family superoxide dismutase
MHRLRAGQLIAIAVLTAAFPLLLRSAAADDAGAGPVATVDATAGLGDLGEPAGAGRFAQVELRSASDRAVAWVDLVQIPTRTRGPVVLVTIRARGLTPGFHGMHIHARGVCDPSGATPFASAGPHLNPSGQAEGMQAGAFPVLLVAPDGTGQAAFTDAGFTLDQLTGADGTSLVIHAGPDNYGNIPPRYSAAGTAGPDEQTMATGDAGPRIACGVISAPGTGTFRHGGVSHAWT